MDENERNAKRLTDVESSIMHLQNDFELLNAAVMENANRLDQLSVILNRLNDRIESKSETEIPRDAEEEKPPHY